jgi:hypothetical protein
MAEIRGRRMKRGWVVTLTKTPRINDFRDYYFPRKTHYKKDALALQTEVREKGGDASVDPAK